MTSKLEHRALAEALMAANKPLHALVHAVLAISADTEFMANLFTTPDERPEAERTMVPAHILERQRANKNKCKCSDNPADIWLCPVHKDEHAKKVEEFRKQEEKPKLPSQEIVWPKYEYKSHCCFAGCTLLECGHCIQENCMCRYKLKDSGSFTIRYDNETILHDNETIMEKDCGV